MPKVALHIFERESKGEKEYRAVIQTGENLQPVSLGIIVYQDEMEVDSKDTEDMRKATRQLKEKAKTWTREQKDENGDPIFVHNIDINPYG
ncbi:MAG: hypothetical protein Q8N59_01365 [bacterium]|nr:hypothetical protein [bacterium]